MKISVHSPPDNTKVVTSRNPDFKFGFAISNRIGIRIKDSTYVKNNIETNGVLNLGRVLEKIFGM